MRLINADVLIEKLDAEPEGGYYSPHDVISLLITQPAIEPERKTGEWEEREVSSEQIIDEWQSARCSVCGLYHTTPYMYYFNDFNFCPSCGARMEKK